jgi:hypothetical protein
MMLVPLQREMYQLYEEPVSSFPFTYRDKGLSGHRSVPKILWSVTMRNSHFLIVTPHNLQNFVLYNENM